MVGYIPGRNEQSLEVAATVKKGRQRNLGSLSSIVFVEDGSYVLIGRRNVRT